MLLLRDGQAAPAVVRRADYSAPAFWVDTVDLCFDLDPAKTRVLNTMRLRRNPAVAAQALRLDGEELNLARVLVNGQGVSFKTEGAQLVLENLPEGNAPFDVEIFTTCAPAKNTSLTGLYLSNEAFFTQCEAEGFRRISYFLDRPDVMASYSVTLRANKALYPVLLSNGNLVEQGDLEDGRHFAKWVDPHKKPSYLFALVAGKLVCREQRITSRAGQEHVLQVYVRSGDLDKTEHAMHSLMAAVAWDEARFGLSLDLERFMIVAVGDFNMGAMENKGLNIFNTKYVLANQATATDVDFSNIESVVGHEYFHNWTGNRVTCRDWFQLSLKEGLTVFRDQEFSQDMAGVASARAVKRIEDVRLLRTVQFAEDAGPMAHPVRPDQYQEINNFYTVTIYEKGAEVVRMMQTLVGQDGFAQGMKLYFARHDGQAVTCDDFAQAIADANPGSLLSTHLAQFKNWYAQAGTPRLQAVGRYDAQAQSYTLSLTQSCAAVNGHAANAPFVLPISLALLDASGQALTLQLAGEAQSQGSERLTERLLVLTQTQEEWVFTNIAHEPVPSLLRNFSAPVILDCNYSDAALLHLLAHDSDAFNRWEAAQRLGLRIATQLIATYAQSAGIAGIFTSENSALISAYTKALRSIARSTQLDAAFQELLLTLPSESYIAEQLNEVDPQCIHAVREALRLHLATALQADWQAVWEQAQATLRGQAYTPDHASAGRRALANLALANLCLVAAPSHDAVWPGKAYQAFKDASNMSERMGALSALVGSVGLGHPLAEQALQSFYALFQGDDLVIDKWFALQAASPDVNGSALLAVKQLMAHRDFSLRNPNRARSVIFSYCSANPGGFHRTDAAGYVFWSERVLELDAINPQVAARLARALDRWKKLAEPYRSAAREAIARVAAKADLSNDVREVVARALAD